MKRKPTFAPSLIQYPSGRFGFVGSVPACLAHEEGDADILTAIAQCGPGLARKIAERRGVAYPQALSWGTREEAIEFATLKGYTL